MAFERTVHVLDKCLSRCMRRLAENTLRDPLRDWEDSRSDQQAANAQVLRKIGPCELKELEIDTPAKVDLLLNMLDMGCVGYKVKEHIRSCLELAAKGNQDVKHDTVVQNTESSILAQETELVICSVNITKGPIHHRSKIEELSNDDVYKLLKTISSSWWWTEWKNYAAEFRRNGVDGKFLKQMTHDDMIALGIKNHLHRKRLDVEVQSLTEARSVQSFNVKLAIAGAGSTNASMSVNELKPMLQNEFTRPLSLLDMRASTDFFQPEDSSQLSSWEIPDPRESCPSDTSSRVSCSSIVSWPSDEARCFIAGTMVHLLEDRGLVNIEKLKEGNLVRSSSGLPLRVQNVTVYPKQLHELVYLQTLTASLTVTASHRVMVRKGGVPQTIAASALREGDDVIISDRDYAEQLERVDRSEEHVVAVQVEFLPDEPLEAFPPPVAGILSKGHGHSRTRRGPSNRRIDAHTNAPEANSSMPDTSASWMYQHPLFS